MVCTPNLMLGLLTGAAVFCLGCALSAINDRYLVLLVLGSWCGCLTSKALLSLVDIGRTMAGCSADNLWLGPLQIGLFFIGLYIGGTATWWASQRWQLDIPFLRLKPMLQRSREIILDPSSLTDPRLLDLATTGIFDRRLVCTDVVLNALSAECNALDEIERNGARRCLDVLNKLQELPNLNLRIDRSDAKESCEIRPYLAMLARQLDADVLVGELSQLETTCYEGIRFISLHALAAALRPLMMTGECLDLKILRHGREPSQGVGYLRDGTMVVVNGGGAFVGSEVRTRVLSVTRSSTGRIVFCNLLDAGLEMTGAIGKMRKD